MPAVMTHLLETYLRSQISLHEQDMAKICSLATHRTLSRGEFMLQEGQVCRHKTFVAKGLLRIYGVSEEGNESVLQFSPENTWTLDAESYDHGTPSQFCIAAVEKSEVLLWTKDSFLRLLAEIPALGQFSQQLISRTGHLQRKRLLSALGASPEEKYGEFVRTSPGLLARLPLHMIASYLGISLKTLTRIRHAQLHSSGK